MCVDAVTSYYLQCNKTTFLWCLRAGEEEESLVFAIWLNGSNNYVSDQSAALRDCPAPV